ncbi:MAG: hypothetical protein U0166_01980 [Acidobacteriota bacterium]
MRKSHLATVAFVITAITPIALAKRAAPPAVKPLLLNGTSYVAHHETVPASGTPTAFVARVEARDPSTGALRWDVTVYTITYKQGLETDVQDVWIASLAAQGSDVLVTDEKGLRYLVEVATHTARKLP